MIPRRERQDQDARPHEEGQHDAENRVDRKAAPPLDAIQDETDTDPEAGGRGQRRHSGDDAERDAGERSVRDRVAEESRAAHDNEDSEKARHDSDQKAGRESPLEERKRECLGHREPSGVGACRSRWRS